MQYDKILAEIEVHVSNLFSRSDIQYLFYHNLHHTQTVVKHAQLIATYYQLNDGDLFILLCSAWFHDTGYLTGNLKDHEEASVQIMLDYFSEASTIEEWRLLNKVAKCILKTRMSAQPSTMIEMILRDADTYHFGTEEFIKTDPLVKNELERRTGKILHNWDADTLKLLESHRFFTGFCKNMLNKVKKYNILITKVKVEASKISCNA